MLFYSAEARRAWVEPPIGCLLLVPLKKTVLAVMFELGKTVMLNVFYCKALVWISFDFQTKQPITFRYDKQEERVSICLIASVRGSSTARQRYLAEVCLPSPHPVIRACVSGTKIWKPFRFVSSLVCREIKPDAHLKLRLHRQRLRQKLELPAEICVSLSGLWFIEEKQFNSAVTDS